MLRVSVSLSASGQVSDLEKDIKEQEANQAKQEKYADDDEARSPSLLCISHPTCFRAAFSTTRQSFVMFPVGFRWVSVNTVVAGTFAERR